MYAFTKNSEDYENYLSSSESTIIQIPRKTTLGYYSLAALKKAKYLNWNDKFGRRYTYSGEGYIIQQVREEDVTKNLLQNLADIGITRQSYFAEITGKWPEPGTEINNLEVVEKLDFCPEVIAPVTLIPSNRYEDKILVQPKIKRVAKMFFDIDYERYYLYSVPSGLRLGIGFLGISRVSPLKEEEFKGSIGENGYPYERLRKYEVVATSKIKINDEEFELKPVYDFPILVKNKKSRKDKTDEIIRELIYATNELGKSVKTYEWKKENGKYVSKEISAKSFNEEMMLALERDLEENYFVLKNDRGKTFLPGSIQVIFYKTESKKLGLENIPRSSVEYKKVNTSKLLKKVVSKAAKGCVEYIVFIGPSEEKRNVVSLKDLKERKQKMIRYEDLETEIFSQKLLQEKVLLVQEPGVGGSKRRLTKPGEKYWQENPSSSIVYTNCRDIPKLVLDGYAEEGVTGYDILLEFLAEKLSLDNLPEIDEFNSFAEKQKIPLRILRLNECGCELCLAQPENVEELESFYHMEKSAIVSAIVTPYPNICKIIFKDCNVIGVSGTAEVYPFAVFDVVSTGETLKRNKKRIVKKLLYSEAIVVRRWDENESKNGKV